MLLKKITAAVTVAGLASAPIAAQAAPLGTIGATNTRISGPAASTSKLGDDNDGTLLILLGLALIAGGVIIASQGGDDDPDQPPVSF
ncbi:hypothetical protein [Croceicoccus marinus]|uniref:LPXTG cell wall anchor domain-containing protein n=1 Tax=Croceicoccus marinus TaxID=450378 RepID=A0A1Z1FBE8_9SPHN|nr:hypothetical protein [Croceicoccus marinus]ARU16074.1 hypothetical protein A9D14_07555 [Croceicoccus marinus]